MRDTRLGLIGYGEVGGIFCAGLANHMDSVYAWDVKLTDDAVAAPLRERAGRDRVALCASAADLCAQANLVISAVTASNTLAVAREAAAHLRPGTIFLDLNSASPGAKREAGAVIEAAGGRYVEAGVMSSVPPHGIRVPMLLGGPHAESLAAQLRDWGMDAQAASPELGIASAIKMCRSVMIKGLEALVIESYTTARAYGVEDHVLPTLQETFPSIDWSEQGRYFYSRVVQHGKRRAEEMREVANTVREAGFDPLMSAATAQKQDWVARLAAKGLFEGVQKSGGWQAYADRLIQQAKRRD
jgi:3-hydroxyisobutyrate dehydrogenase-like beta-hydroxyacid dehydrogenase